MTRDSTVHKLLELIDEATMVLHAALHVGNPAPIVEHLCRAHDHPRPGDMVIEISSCHNRGHTRMSRIGTLLKVETTRRGTTYTLLRLDGKKQRWTNARFVRVFERNGLRDIDERLMTERRPNDPTS